MIEESAYVLPGEPLPIRLMNTLRMDRGAIRDDLSTAPAVVQWLRATGFDCTSASPDDVRAASRLRDAAREVAGFVTHDARPRVNGQLVEEAIEVINVLASGAQGERLLLDGDQIVLAAPDPDGSASAALSMLARACVQFFTSPGLDELRACNGPRCVLFFAKDHPRREWCDAACGSRARAARYYRRHKKGAAA